MRCLGKGTQVLPSPILDYRAALYGLGVEGSGVPSGADEEEVTQPQRSYKCVIPKAELQVLTW